MVNARPRVIKTAIPKTCSHVSTIVDETIPSFNPKPEAMAGSGMDRPHAASAIAFGFGLNETMRCQSERAPQETHNGGVP